MRRNTGPCRGNGFAGRGGRGGRAPNNNAALRANIITKQTNSVRRLQKDLKELREADVPLYGVTAAPRDNSIFEWCGNLRGPENSAFKGGVFHISMTFPQNYPCSPPTVQLMTSIPHPNVFGRNICLDMLQKSKSSSAEGFEGWTSAYTVQSVLLQLQSFLFEAPADAAILQDESFSVSEVMSKRNEHRTKYKKAVEEANAFKCTECSHRGPIEPYPKFHEKDQDEDAYVVVRDPKKMLEEEFLCYHSKTKLPESSLGIGISISRLPRTGEIRSVQPTLDLLCLRAFTKQKVRTSASNERFTHWLPLFFGEREEFERKTQVFDEKTEQFVTKSEKIDPFERNIKLLKHALCFLTDRSTRKEFRPEMVLEVIPKMLVQHLVDLCDLTRTVSIVAIRRMVNFMRLFRLLMKMYPEIEKTIDEQLEKFIKNPELRVKDHFSSLGDLLVFSIISNKFTFKDLVDCYLEEQLDRQAFWIIRSIPELDHTDPKYKGKQVLMETQRNETCFKTGLVGFHMTCTINVLAKTLAKEFGNDLNKMDEQLDNNFGCLPLKVEDKLLYELKNVKRIGDFSAYYSALGQKCLDDEALATRLRKAIDNSKAKKYHGSSEHMNELPTRSNQAKEVLEQEPKPFRQYDEAKKTFAVGTNEEWMQCCIDKFSWIKQLISSNQMKGDKASIEEAGSNNPACKLAQLSDDKHINRREWDVKTNDVCFINNASNNMQGWQASSILRETSQEDYEYPAFNFRKLFHKLCFEQMLEYFSQTLDFKLLYKYMEVLGPEVPILRVNMIKKEKLKSNNYWIMALVGKMPALEVIKFHNRQNLDFGDHGWKYLQKGLAYLQGNKRSLKKVQINDILKSNWGNNYIYSSLKTCPELRVLKMNNNQLNQVDTQAIAKIISEFKHVKELDLSNCSLTASTAQFIADGLMRAKGLEIIKVQDNPSIGKGLQQIVYNLAFSPKIKYIDTSNNAVGNAETAESIQKLIKISGAIETLNLSGTGLFQHLTEQFFVAVGESKTIRYLNLDSTTKCGKYHLMAKAIAMNARKNGSLVGVSMKNWINGHAAFMNFFDYMKVSEQQHEMWYGDMKTAQKMQKQDLVVAFHCNLEFLDLEGSTQMANMTFRHKAQIKLVKPVWPTFFKFVSQTKCILNLRNSGLAGNMDSFVYAIGANPVAACQMVSLDLSKNPIMKEGAKQLALGIAANHSLRNLDLSCCNFGVRGMQNLANALKENSTLQTVNFYRNIIDVDGARELGKVLAVNKTLKSIDIGHNRIRKTGLEAIVNGIKANKNCALDTLGIRANFINDDAFNSMFEELVLDRKQLKVICLKNNFLTEFNKIALAKKCIAAKSQVYVDDFQTVDLLDKEKLDRTIWISPMAPSYANHEKTLGDFFMDSHDCGLVVDVRLRSGKARAGRPNVNTYCVVEFAHENSVPRCLKVASKKLATFGGHKARIFKAGTRTAICLPNQRRHK